MEFCLSGAEACVGDAACVGEAGVGRFAGEAMQHAFI